MKLFLVKALLPLIILGNFLMFSSCSFTPEEEFFIEIDKTNISTPVISFLDSSDTLYFRGGVQIQYDLEEGFDYYGYELFLEDSLIEKGEDFLGDIYFSSLLIKDGVYNLELIFYVKTNTESMADKLGAEASVLSLKKVAIVDNSELILEIKPFTIENGSLILNWESNPGYLFDRYEIAYFTDNYFTPDIDTLIYNKAVKSLGIDDYCGGPVRFEVNVFAKNTTSNATVVFEYEFNIEAELRSDSLILYSIYNPFNSLKNYQLTHEYDVVSYELIDSYEFNFVSNENYIITTRDIFPKKNYFVLSVVNSKNKASQVKFIDFHANNQLDYTNTEKGEVFFNVNSFVEYNKAPDQKGTYNRIYDKAILHNSNDGLIISTLEGVLGISSGGETLVKLDGTQMQFYDVNTFNLLSEVNLSSIVTFTGTPIQIGIEKDIVIIKCYDRSFSIPYQRPLGYEYSYYIINTINNSLIEKGKGSIYPQNNYRPIIAIDNVHDSGNYSFKESSYSYYYEDIYDVNRVKNFGNSEDSSYAYSVKEDIFLRSSGSWFETIELGSNNVVNSDIFPYGITRLISNKSDLYGIIYENNSEYFLGIYEFSTFREIQSIRITQNSIFDIELINEYLIYDKQGYNPIYFKKVN